MKLDEWAQEVEGEYLDRDGYPTDQPYQCHDVWLDYLVEVVGGTVGDGHAPGVGYTSAVLDGFPNHRPGLAHLVTAHQGASGVRAGDVLFWPPGTPAHPESHTAVALARPDAFGRIECMSQNPGPARTTTLSTSGMSGYLRPITDPTGADMTPAQSRKLDEVHAALHALTKPGGTLDLLPTLTARATLDTPIVRHGTDKPTRTTLRTLIAKSETLTRRILARLTPSAKK